MLRFDDLEAFIEVNNKRPSHRAKDADEKKLGMFYSTCLTNYN